MSLSLQYAYTILTMAFVNSIAVQGLNLTTGYAGQPNLGQAAFYGIGAYTSALLSVRLGLPFWACPPAAFLVAALAGLLVGAISIRLREDFLAIATIGVNLVVVAVFLYTPIFGRALGIGGLPMPVVGGFEFSRGQYLLLVTMVSVAVALGVRHIARAWLGLMLRGVEQDEVALSVLGMDPVRLKLASFSLGTALAGLAGSLYAHFMSFISPYDFGFPVSVAFLSMLILGGPRSPWGPIAGSLFLTVLPELFRFIQEYRMLIYGFLLVVMLRYRPSGLLGKAGTPRKRLGASEGGRANG